jgi:hypothetical protein
MLTFGQKITFCRKENKLCKAAPGRLSGINSDIYR